jgi:hypothetical protein
MAESREAWEQVGREFGALGRQVRQRYQEQAGSEEAAPAAEQRKVEDALRQLRDSLDQAFTTLGEAIRDPEFGEQSKKAASSLSDAMAATFAEVSERFKRR